MIEIKNRFSGRVIKSVGADSLFGVDFSGANLSGADLCQANLRKANLSGADLREADLYWADLCEANLRGANLYGADLCEANLRRANLYEANLYKANLRGADLYEANLSFCKGVLSFTCEKHQGVYFKYEDTYYFKIGCITEPSEWWLENFETVGRKEDYNEGHIKLYGEMIKLYSSYEIRGEK